MASARVEPRWEGQPWGFYTNYPDPTRPNVTNEMLTDAMATAAGRARVAAQLAGMQQRNATMWRIFPQFQDVLTGPDTVNVSGIATLTAALDMAAAHGFKVTVTGLSDFVPAHNPQWLDDAGEALDSERKIRAASKAWWAALASAFKGHPAVFSFDLQNEPMWMSGPTSGNPNAPGANPWATGCMGAVGDAKCFDFKHNRHWQHTWTEWVHTHFTGEAAIRAAWPDYPMSPNDTWSHPAVPVPVSAPGATPPAADAVRHANYTTHIQQMQRDWATDLASAIRAVDSSRLISVGNGFVAATAVYSDRLDYYSVHLYPRPTINTTAALEAHFRQQMALLPDDGKPVFVEEFFPLGLAPGISYAEYLKVFIKATQPRARAYATYFCPVNGANPIGNAMCEAWLGLVAAYAANATRPL